MSSKPDRPHARRCLMPPALSRVLTGVVPPELASELSLPPVASFESLDPVSVDVSNHEVNRQLLDHLTRMVKPAIASRQLNLIAPAFPHGVRLTVDVRLLPLLARTRQCLEREGLLSEDALAWSTLKRLMAVRAFGVRSLVDVLTAVEAANSSEPGQSGPPHSIMVVPGRDASTLSPRLTHEARLLADEPWTKSVSLYDVRLGPALLTEENPASCIKEAFDDGRLGFDRPLYLAPPGWDMNLLRLPLQALTRIRLRKEGITSLAAVSSLTVEEMLKVRGIGAVILEDLLTLLDACRHLIGTTSSFDSEPTLHQYCRAVVGRRQDNWFPDRLADRMKRARALGVRCLSLPIEDELYSLAATIKESHAGITTRYLGWDGQGRRSLDIVAAAKGVTRERVRQIALTLTHRLSEVPAWTPTLGRALELCEQLCPLPVDRLAALLHEKGLTRAPFHPHGLLTAAKVLGRSHRLSLLRSGQTEWLVRRDPETL